MKRDVPVVLALDCGSTNFKAAVFDHALRRLGTHSLSLGYAVQGRSRVEFDPEETWRLTVRLIRETCAQAGVRPAAVRKISLTSQANTFSMLDVAGRPQLPFLSWLDQRAKNEAAMLNKRLGVEFHRHCSWPRVLPGLQAAMTLWLRRHRPRCLKQAAAIVTLPGFLAIRLGAANAVDINLAAMSGLYSLQTGRWWQKMLTCCGLQESQMPMLVKPGQSIPISTPCRDLQELAPAAVVLAGNDQSAGAFGNYCSPRSLLVTLGTALVVYRVMDQRRGPYTPNGAWGPYLGGGYYELAMCTGCAVLDWARQQLLPGRDVKAFDALAAKTLTRRTRHVHRDGESLFFPAAVKTSRAWIGVESPGERALAVYEGIAFSLKQLIRDEWRVVSRLPDIVAVGGGSQSRVMLQVLADILNTRVGRGTGDALLGAARLACAGTGAGASSILEWFHPRQAAFYESRYKRWRKASAMSGSALKNKS